ncbi:thiamine pyrophosphate-dependent enzyme [Mycoplasmopsis bovis]|uniref:2-oxoisovalerate dehydrogenase subunit alpha n=4 Tax=Mycoplasmopsis bovis TaxID=28903 RepID=A0A193CK90_MYCBV|nr:thiamine pyrophosphate-dependent enzyme [Mycoplasmopsis bovis]ADR24735.1 pyruvate dehydrogenase E1 component, alpha subunit [Mycoplasmopsis bovis PG45]AEI89810.1 pyruvate dehydrogenase E1 component, alpha subunit [Mycoplasmopsis bovis Hubei-1]AFM51477.1 pyruvate dehydrogenase E1 component subunit alpha [Mycoplasmopsis bovis HB0801]AIA33689.1 pyruvate dehydrogenase E1 component subunit alpha [Mycoplasmopsis bovis CQ-W70]AKO50330.1 pyruvate dehydrogenase [Mycoplasmopsis bovis]
MNYKYVKPGHATSDPNETVRFLDVDGKLIQEYKPSEETKKKLVEMYKNMIRSRQWDLYSLTLQKTGRLGTFAPALGEEAALTGIGYNLNKEDWFIPHYRVLPTQLARGISMDKIYSYWQGSEIGSAFAGTNTLPLHVVIGSQVPIAAGVAQALKFQGKKALAMVTIGNGGTNEGEFHEGLNMASVRKWPLVTVVMNNQWAISVPEHNSYIVKTLSQRAKSYDMPGVRVDGNDLIAVNEVMQEVYDFVREGNGPVLVEMVTWRQGQHTTSDNPRVYRSRELEVEKEKWEPFHRIEAYLLSEKLITEEDIKVWSEAAYEEAKAAYALSKELCEATTFDHIYDYTYEKLPADLVRQKETNRKLFGK